MIHEPKGYAIANGVRILSQTFSPQKKVTWNLAVETFDKLCDQPGCYPFGRTDYPRNGSKTRKVVWLKKRGCKLFPVKIVVLKKELQ